MCPWEVYTDNWEETEVDLKEENLESLEKRKKNILYNSIERGSITRTSSVMNKYHLEFSTDMWISIFKRTLTGQRFKC